MIKYFQTVLLLFSFITVMHSQDFDVSISNGVSQLRNSFQPIQESEKNTIYSSFAISHSITSGIAYNINESWILRHGIGIRKDGYRVKIADFNETNISSNYSRNLLFLRTGVKYNFITNKNKSERKNKRLSRNKKSDLYFSVLNIYVSHPFNHKYSYNGVEGMNNYYSLSEIKFYLGYSFGIGKNFRNFSAIINTRIDRMASYSIASSRMISYNLIISKSF